jgi:predicted nuclease of predicted toxin-antitoxin system
VRFLADESCDFAVVVALRTASHDVTAVVELAPAAADDVVLALARGEGRILLTEDKDFGQLAYAGRHGTAGVILIRFPAHARSSVGQAVVDVVAGLGDRITNAFVVAEPGRARVSRPRAID